MRHRIAGKQLCRDTDHRRAMLRNLAAGLFEHGQIETTLPKAKAVQPFVERIITIAKRGTFTSRRRIEQLLNDRKIHAWVADPSVGDAQKSNPYFELPDADDIQFNRYGDVRKAPRLVQHIMTTIAPMFADRNGGYTRIVKLSKRRLGDGTDLVVLQLVSDADEGSEVRGEQSRRRVKADGRKAWFEQKFGNLAGPTAVAEPKAESVATTEAEDEAGVESATETDSATEDAAGEPEKKDE